MAYTTNQLIAGAYYASGVVSREFETVNGTQFADGLGWLNDIITEKTVDDGMVPYETTYDLNLVTGQEMYFIPDLISVDTFTFYLDAVRYSMKYTQRNEYFGATRVENVETLPFQWYVERCFGGANLYVYFPPNQDYPAVIHGVFRLQTVAAFQDLSLTLDEFMRTYFRYALADRICCEYEIQTPANVMRQLNKYESWINKKSRILDMRINKLSTLQGNSNSINYAYVNLGHGWMP